MTKLVILGAAFAALWVGASGGIYELGSRPGAAGYTVTLRLNRLTGQVCELDTFAWGSDRPAWDCK